MVRLYEHGTVEVDYYRLINIRGSHYKVGYLFRLMSDGTLLFRQAQPKTKWRIIPGLKGLKDFQKLSTSPNWRLMIITQ